MTLIKNDCGKHWGKGGPCSKCAHFSKTRRERPENYQYSGTPWIAVLEPASHDSIQERAIEAAHRINGY